MKYKIVKRYGGGGGTETTETIPEWARPYMQKVGDTATSLYDKGSLSKVADLSANQREAIGMGSELIKSAGTGGTSALADQQSRLAGLASTGGIESLRDAMNLEAGQEMAKVNTQFGAANTLGSARNQLASKLAENATIAKYQDKAIANKLAAEQAIGKNIGGAFDLASSTASGLAKLGSEERSVEQQKLDADATGLQRLASAIYANPSRQQTVAGGK